MDPLAWLIAVTAVAVAGGLALAGPWMLRDNRRRQQTGGGGSMAGVGAGLDAVWRPSAEDAHAEWRAAVELPAPAPAPGDKGLDDGPLVIRVGEPDETD